MSATKAPPPPPSGIGVKAAQAVVDQLETITNLVPDRDIEAVKQQLAIVQGNVSQLLKQGTIPPDLYSLTVCSLTTTLARLQKVAGRRSEVEKQELEKAIGYLAVIAVLWLGYYVVKDPSYIKQLAVVTYNVTLLVTGTLAVITAGALLYWGVSTLFNNQGDVGKTIADMMSTVIEEIVEAIGDLLVDLASSLWNAITGELDDLSTTDSGGPEWYDFFSPILAIDYVKQVADGSVFNPLSSSSNKTCPNVAQLEAFLKQYIASGGNVLSNIPFFSKPTSSTSTIKYVYSK